MLIAENGAALASIVMAHPAHETIKYACDELREYIWKITGASIPVTTELINAQGARIYVGASAALAQSMGIVPDIDALGEEGYIIACRGGALALAGASPRGTLYAVYAFLEEELGVRWFSKDCERVPRALKLEVGDIARVDKPAFESREAYWREAFDGGFAVRNRMNSNKADISVRQGGRMKFYNFHHSFDDLVPVREYFDTHPEYFSLVNGARKRERSQLCLTNPNVLKITTARVKHWIRENPDCRVFSVAQNDWDGHCECDACQRIAERELSEAGPMIAFVNALADDIAREYPDKLIHTFAYQYTRKAPKHIRPRPNVIVRLCSIECCFSHPLDGQLDEGVTLAENQNFKRQCATMGDTLFMRDLKEWSAICDRLYIWDYVTDFSNYLYPFANFGVLKRNLVLFRDMGVKGVLEQGNFSHGGGGHLSEMQAYLQAKLMWNPDADICAHMLDFARGFYGEAAAAPIMEYIQLWQTACAPYHFGINEGAHAPWITDDILMRADELLSRALHLAASDAQKTRVERLRLGITQLTLARMPVSTPGRELLIRRFAWDARRLGVSEIHERRTLDESISRLIDPSKELTQVADYKM